MSVQPNPKEITQILRRAHGGDRAAVDELLPLIYDELHALAGRFMARERNDHTLQATALVHEAYVRLVDQENLAVDDRAQFFGIAANVIRRILIDHARQHAAAKRGGGWDRMTLSAAEAGDECDSLDLLALEEALQKLAALSDRAAQVVTMRFFGGLTVEQIAESMNLSKRTIADDWAMARAWLRRELDDGTSKDKDNRL